MSEKVEIFHFDDIANSYHGESLYCGLSSSLSLQVDKDCTITVYGQINPRSGEFFQLQVLNEKTMKTSANITEAGNYFVHIAGCYNIKFEVENATDVDVGGVFGKYHYPSAEVDLDDYASIEYVDSKIGAATEEEFKEMLKETLGLSVFPEEVGVVDVQSISLNKSNVSLVVGENETLVATIFPSNATNRNIVWSIKPEGFATVEDGKISAVSSGVGTVTASIGSKSFSCRVTVWDVSETQDIPGRLPIYKLQEEKTFVSSDKECVDTGVKMFDVLSPKPNWTLLLEATTGTDVEDKSDAYCLVHCMDEKNQYPGMSLAIWASSTSVQSLYGFNLFGSHANTINVEDSKTNKFKVAIQISNDGKWRIRKAIGAEDSVTEWDTIYDYGPAIDKTLLLGCYQQEDGTNGRFWDGVLHQALLYDVVLTNEELDTWFSKQ